ncbi:hypothetical protein [uncultured Roseibium sp.]|uniref:hypothetical protein n=1 Tax=uncultured Roseibium sp. TaxID=1936171 RepID=UPI002628CA8D|nr:hypothetical protein [uncultured Roseibium sp.]
MASIAYDAALAAKEAPFQRTSYSRRKKFYEPVSRYWGTEYGYSTVVHSVDALVEAGLLVEHDRRPPKPNGNGIQSSYMPAPFLRDLDLPEADCKVGELMRLKDADGKLVSYRETDRIARERKFLEKFNRHIAEADIRLNAGVPDGRMIRFPGHAVYPDFDELYRVYNGGWSSGGRFYGGWWQQVRSCDRIHFLIDGAPTCELDFEMLHPRLVYAMSGHSLESDAYTIDGWDRSSCKRAFNILLNAGSYESAVGAIQPHVGGDKSTARQLVKAIKQRHRRIERFFHSGAGLRLQNVDAEIAKSVLREMTVKNGITALPIHDSFIVRQDQKDRLMEEMDKAYSRVTSNAGIKTTTSMGYRKTDPHMAAGTQGDSGGVSIRPTANDQSAGRDLETTVPSGNTGLSAKPSGAGVSSGSAFALLDPTRSAREDTVIRSVQEPNTVSVQRPRRPVPRPAFLFPEDNTYGQRRSLKHLADQPLKKRRTIEQIPTVRKTTKGKSQNS